MIKKNVLFVTNFQLGSSAEQFEGPCVVYLVLTDQKDTDNRTLTTTVVHRTIH